MATYAEVRTDGTVHCLVESTIKPEGNGIFYIDVTGEDVKQEMIYQDGEFISPIPHQPTDKLITKLEFINRFPLDKQIMLLSPDHAALTDRQKAFLKMLIAKLQLAHPAPPENPSGEYVDLLAQDTILGVRQLQEWGLITETEANSVLA